MSLEDFTGDSEDVNIDDESDGEVDLNKGNFEEIVVLGMQNLKEDLNEIKDRLEKMEDS